MKTKHRHELKTNELAEWLANFPQWARKNLTTIIYVSVVFVLVIGVYFWKRHEKTVVTVRRQTKLTNLMASLSHIKRQILEAQEQGRDYSFMLLQAADNIRGAAEDVDDDQMAALGFIKRAEALRAELHYRQGTIGRDEATEQLDKTRVIYTEALVKAKGNPSLMAAAKFGLGLCEEELGNFEQAEQIYRQTAQNASFEGTTAAVQAKQRLETMADYQQEVSFKPAPKQTPTEPVQPEIKPERPEEAQAQNSVSDEGLYPVTDMNSPDWQDSESLVPETVER